MRFVVVIRVIESRVVVKVLVFGFLKKLVKLKRFVELSFSVKKLCSGMRKFEVGSKIKGLGVNNKVEVLIILFKTLLRIREVKSRVFDLVLL